MTSNNTYIKKVLPGSPILAFRRSLNIKDVLIKTKLFPIKRKNDKIYLKGMKKCNIPCIACPFVLTTV